MLIGGVYKLFKQTAPLLGYTEINLVFLDVEHCLKPSALALRMGRPSGQLRIANWSRRLGHVNGFVSRCKARQWNLSCIATL